MTENAEHDVRQFRFIFAVSVAVFFVVATVVRLLPRSWRPWTTPRRGRRSLIAEAKSVANTFIPFAFMR